MHTCVYCKKEKPVTCFTKKHEPVPCFTKEHVIPQAFGKFGSQTPTLVNKVCWSCNQKFGETIDIALVRGTPEGVHRFTSGLKDVKDFQPSKHAQNQTRVAETGFLSGQELGLVKNSSSTGLTHALKNPSDVALKRKEDNQYDFFLLKNLPDKKTLERKYFLDEIKIVNLLRKKKIANHLSKLLNVPHILEDSIEEGDCQVEYKYAASNFSEVIRGIAKIAFNYFAFHNNMDILLQSCFDPIRNFIHKGTGKWNEFVTIEKEPIIPDENKKDIHLVVVTVTNNEIYASVSLHNLRHYKVCLALQYQGLPIKTEYGKWFDPHAQKTDKLGKSSLVMAESVSLIVPVKPTLWIPS